MGCKSLGKTLILTISWDTSLMIFTKEMTHEFKRKGVLGYSLRLEIAFACDANPSYSANFREKSLMFSYPSRDK
ncbi:hypothetical protein ANRL3_00586 [Anaerolineae bacterium]|nr:hypothetical protein ANRL3_00586 [Anaerolineae bacterium]